MKKENLNLVLAMIMTIGVFLLAGFYFLMGKALDGGLSGTAQMLGNMMQGGEMNDVEGYAWLIHGIGYGLGKLGYILLIAVAVLLTVYGVLLGGFAIAARAAFNRNRLTPYRVLMSIEYVLQAVAELLLLSNLISHGFNPVALGVELLLLGMTIWSAVNTYGSM